MKITTLIAGACLCFVATGALQAQKTETKVVTIEGDIIRYEPGRTIVIRSADKKEITYTLSPTVVIPSSLAVGNRVTLYTDPAAATTVTRVVTTGMTPSGEVTRTTEETTKHPSGATTKTTTVEVLGKVESYEAGKTVTIVKSDGNRVTYMINPKSVVPTDLAIGKTVTILPMADPEDRVVKTVTYTVVKK